MCNHYSETWKIISSRKLWIKIVLFVSVHKSRFHSLLMAKAGVQLPLFVRGLRFRLFFMLILIWIGSDAISNLLFFMFVI